MITTSTINNIHNLKYFNQIQELLKIDNVKEFANKINDLFKQIETMKEAINDYENERQYLMDEIAEMKGTKNIYIFDKEEYNTVPEHFINTNANINIEEKEQTKQDILNTVFQVVKTGYETETNIINISDLMQKKEQQEQQGKKEETYIFNSYGMYDYSIKNDDEYIKRMNDKGPLNKYNTFEDYINNFSIYDKEDKKAAKKAIVEDFKKAGFKVKANNGYYNSLDIILEIKKDDIIDNDIYNKAKNNLYENYKWQELDNYYNLNLNKDINLTEKENIDIIKEYFEKKINKLEYSRVYVEQFNTKDDKKQRIEELFFKDDVLSSIKNAAKKILFKYSILKSYDAYSDYSSTYLTFNFDFIIKLID